MTSHHDLDIVQLTHPHDAGPALRQQLTNCWIAVSNSGGAVGFPFPPVSAQQVAPVVDNLAARLHPQRSRMLLALSSGVLTGWVVLRRDANRLIAHWGTVNHLQTHPAYRNQGSGSELMH